MTPDEFTLQETYVEVGNGHRLYVHDWGNQKAKHPILFLHGGPGAGVTDKHKQRFSPETQRVIFFDQRGVGKSLPKGSLNHNTTEDLTEDIERIARQLHLESFVLTGGSWGSCLALVYAIKYPKRVKALLLTGIFTGRASEIAYLDNGEFKTFYPDLWEKYVASVPESYRNDPSSYHYQHVHGEDADKAKRSAYAYSEFLEGPLLHLDDRYSPEPYEEFDPSAMQIELHYLKNKCFLADNYIMQHAQTLDMPVWIVQGRYDMVCPPTTAYELSKKLPNCHLIWTTAGHGNDRANYDVMRTLYLQLGA